MCYEDNILKKIKDSNKRPSFENNYVLDTLDQYAEDFFKKNTIEWYLWCLLIYHQISEEMIKILNNCSDFLIQCNVYPNQYKNQKKNGKKKTYGFFLQELKNGITNDEINEFIEKCQKLNELRNSFFHEITEKSELKNFKEEIKKSKRIFKEIYNLFENIYDYYRISFHDVKKDIEDLE